MIVVAFDLDGTLVTAGVIGQRAALAATRAVTGREPDDLPPRAGRTDRAIGLDYLIAAGVDHDDAPGLLDDYLAALHDAAMDLMGDYRALARVLPGARDVLEALHGRDDVVSVLVTGNIRSVAEAKLRVLGLHDLVVWECGGYGDDSTVRAELVHTAWQAASRYTTTPIPPGRVIVVGDTPRDIDAARTAGVAAVAVATGPHTAAELDGADLVLPDLSDPEAVRRILNVCR
ncbi:HAD family hydrolase [Longispora fulva]|uniref:Phosphoglycolate phosphatase-like HAD superfamily hydrolase n=1 Tax=Longispora fulva TaxID=619741 RepID=A0A8J7KIC3_9ACTN|nr:HAD family hydrolase [Longispora fulva]MBG6136009.1 phosphoglycolate phosphatase-like HAD superfamily hydrolase [Longispora fulva]